MSADSGMAGASFLPQSLPLNEWLVNVHHSWPAW